MKLTKSCSDHPMTKDEALAFWIAIGASVFTCVFTVLN